MLMKQVQEATPRAQAVTGERLRNAVDHFASENLLTILMAEASGILDSASRKVLPLVLSSLPSARCVERGHLEQAVVDAGLPRSAAQDMAEFLFLEGLLGNLNVENGYVQFYYRRDTYSFSIRGPWTLHRALMYAFNVPW